MDFLVLGSSCSGAATTVHLLRPVDTRVGNRISMMLKKFHPSVFSGYKFDVRASSSRKSFKKSKRDAQQSKSTSKNGNRRRISEATEVSSPGSNEVQDESNVYDVDDSISKNPIEVASRSNVLQACTVTSGLMAALGLIIRQTSHVASSGGLPIPDCTGDISFGFETWHLELIAGLVIFISSCRFLLLKSWPDFAESSEAANRQVLTSLEPLDYLVVAFLPGISEEILFRGALLPLFGTNFASILAVGAVFGVLHLGSGRKYSFAVWASFVGIVYGYAAVLSSSVVVPMASHALNNLVGGVLWRSGSKSNSSM